MLRRYSRAARCGPSGPRFSGRPGAKGAPRHPHTASDAMPQPTWAPRFVMDDGGGSTSQARRPGHRRPAGLDAERVVRSQGGARGQRSPHGHRRASPRRALTAAAVPALALALRRGFSCGRRLGGPGRRVLRAHHLASLRHCGQWSGFRPRTRTRWNSRPQPTHLSTSTCDGAGLVTFGRAGRRCGWSLAL
jgi:hypothetical protein